MCVSYLLICKLLSIQRPKTTMNIYYSIHFSGQEFGSVLWWVVMTCGEWFSHVVTANISQDGYHNRLNWGWRAFLRWSYMASGKLRFLAMRGSAIRLLECLSNTVASFPQKSDSREGKVQATRLL